MSYHDSDYSTDYPTKSDPPRQHPLLAAMDRITSSVTAVRFDVTPSQDAPVASNTCSGAGPMSCRAVNGGPPTENTEWQTVAYDSSKLKALERTQPEDREPKEWPLLTLREFTISTITAIKNGEMEDEALKTTMSKKYRSYCHDRELMKPILDVLATCGERTRDMCHQLVHTMLDNLGTGYDIHHSIEDIPGDVTCLREDWENLCFPCLNKPSLSSPAIVSCLASYARLSHRLLSALDTKENQENIWAHCRKIGEILAKYGTGEVLTDKETELSKRDGDKSMSELENELGLVQTPPFDKFVIQVASFGKLCVQEAERQLKAEKEG